jgi:serine/threonine protein kinase
MPQNNPEDPQIPASSLLSGMIGTTIEDKFQITGILGTGGMSTVYKATQLQFARNVAIKVLHQAYPTTKEMQKRFHREAQIIASLRHPNIVRVYGYGLVGGYSYLAMELAEGCSLAHVLATEKKLAASEALPVFEQILDALAYAHKQGVIHRDIKPSNVMLVGDKRTVKLLDFGLAKVAPEFGQQLTTLTSANQVQGTVFYMSPEQAKGKQVDYRSDIYSMACLMYETLTGQPPFTGDNAFAILLKHTQTPAPVHVSLENPLGQVVLYALEKDPKDRPQSAEDLIQLLQHPPHHPASRKRPILPRWSAQPLFWLALGLAALCGLGASVSFMGRFSGKQNLERSTVIEDRAEWDAVSRAHSAMERSDFKGARKILEPFVAEHPQGWKPSHTAALDLLAEIATHESATLPPTLFRASMNGLLKIREQRWNYTKKFQNTDSPEYWTAMVYLARTCLECGYPQRARDLLNGKQEDFLNTTEGPFVLETLGEANFYLAMQAHDVHERKQLIADAIDTLKKCVSLHPTRFSRYPQYACSHLVELLDHQVGDNDNARSEARKEAIKYALFDYDYTMRATDAELSDRTLSANLLSTAYAEAGDSHKAAEALKDFLKTVEKKDLTPNEESQLAQISQRISELERQAAKPS